MGQKREEKNIQEALLLVTLVFRKTPTVKPWFKYYSVAVAVETTAPKKLQNPAAKFQSEKFRVQISGCVMISAGQCLE